MPSLVTWPDEHGGQRPLLRLLHQPVRAVAHLGDRPRRARRGRDRRRSGSSRARARCGPTVSTCASTCGQRRLGHHQQRRRRARRPARPARRTCAHDSSAVTSRQRRAGRRPCAPSAWSSSVLLPMPGLPCEQRTPSRARDRPRARGRARRRRSARGRAMRRRRRRSAPDRPAQARGVIRGGASPATCRPLDQGAPRVARRAAPEPTGRLAATLRAPVDHPRLHPRTLRRGYDTQRSRSASRGASPMAHQYAGTRDWAAARRRVRPRHDPGRLPARHPRHPRGARRRDRRPGHRRRHARRPAPAQPRPRVRRALPGRRRSALADRFRELYVEFGVPGTDLLPARPRPSTRCTTPAAAVVVVTAKYEPNALRCLTHVGLSRGRGVRVALRRRQGRDADRRGVPRSTWATRPTTCAPLRARVRTWSRSRRGPIRRRAAATRARRTVLDSLVRAFRRGSDAHAYVAAATATARPQQHQDRQRHEHDGDDHEHDALRVEHRRRRVDGGGLPARAGDRRRAARQLDLRPSARTRRGCRRGASGRCAFTSTCWFDSDATTSGSVGETGLQVGEVERAARRVRRRERALLARDRDVAQRTGRAVDLAA